MQGQYCAKPQMPNIYSIYVTKYTPLEFVCMLASDTILPPSDIQWKSQEANHTNPKQKGTAQLLTGGEAKCACTCTEIAELNFTTHQHHGKIFFAAA